MTERAIHLGLLISSLAFAGWLFGVHDREGAPSHSSSASHATRESAAAPLSLIPPGSAFVLSADVKGIQQAPLGSFLAQRLGQVRGAGQLSKLCGFDPLARLDHLALAVPSAGLATHEQPEDFGIVANGRFNAEEIMRCARAAIAQRNGEAVSTKLGSFDTVRDPKRAGGEVAARDGLLLVSGGSYFRELLDAAEGNAAKRDRANPREVRHLDLRRALGTGPIIATWLLGEGWLERVAGEDSGARLSPLAELRAVAARIDLEQAVNVTLLLECSDSESAARVSSLLGEMRSSLQAMPLDPALSSAAQRIAVSQTGARLRLHLELSQAELRPLLDLLLGPA